MKKIVALCIALLMILSLAACSGTVQENGSEPVATEAPAPKTASEDTDVLAMHFSAPEGYENVERSAEVFADGAFSQKSLTYSFSDSSEIIVGYTFGHSVSEAVSQEKLDVAESAEYGGKPFIVIEEGRTLMAVYEENNEMYAVGYTFVSEIDREKFDTFMSQISFTDNTQTDEIDADMYDIRYTIDSSWKLSSTNCNLTETPDGTVVKKTIGWHVGEDEDNLDFRFIIRVFKNTTVEQQLNTEKEYEEQEINGITYTVLKNSDGKKSYEYYTQHGDDVYEIRNNGVSDGWGVERSEESEVAFEALLNSISFTK